MQTYDYVELMHTYTLFDIKKQMRKVNSPLEIIDFFK